MKVSKSRTMIGIKDLRDQLPDNMYLIRDSPIWYIFNKNSYTKRVRVGFLKYKKMTVYEKWKYPFTHGTIYATLCPMANSIIVHHPDMTNFLTAWGKKFKYDSLSEAF